MPFKNPKDKLKYMKEYYAADPERVERKYARNRARYHMEKAHGKEALKGKDIDHVDNNPKNNKRSNLRVVSRSLNRSRKI